MATDPLFGWDLTFKTVEKDIKRKSDVLIAFIHWNLARRGFRSIGVGDEVQYSKSILNLFVFVMRKYLKLLDFLKTYLPYQIQKNSAIKIRLTFKV